MNRLWLILRAVRLALTIADEIELMQAKKAVQAARMAARGVAAGKAAKASSEATRSRQ